jgi:hypothetical protein
MAKRLLKIVSGGQTGADRAALDWAIKYQISHGGWCPEGRMAEDGTIAACYHLTELPGGGYRQRTKANVQDSDATLIVSTAPELSGGSLTTAKFGDQLRKPWLHVHPGINWKSHISDWLSRHDIHVLNVAGPRASKEPDVAVFTHAVLDEAIRHYEIDNTNKTLEDVPIDSTIIGWIDGQIEQQEAYWLALYALAFNRLDVSPLRDRLASEVTYDSQSVFETMHGPDAFLKYLEGKFRAIRTSSNRVAAELATLPGGKLCVAMYQAGSDMDTNWLDTPLAAMTVTMTPDGLAKSMLMITCAPAPSSARGTGLFPGRDVPPTTQEKRFIRPSPSFQGINVYFYYLDGEMHLDKAMEETANYVRGNIDGIKVIDVLSSNLHLNWTRQKVFEAFRFNGFPSVGAMFNGKVIYRHAGLIDGPELVAAIKKTAPLYVAAN